MKAIRNIVEIDEEKCDGCGLCVPACAEGAIVIENGKARLVGERYCDGLGACLGECPQDAIRIIEREAEEFDEEAVEEHLKTQAAVKDQPFPEAPSLACGCPSSQMMSFASGTCTQANEPTTQTAVASELTHWPVQIRLVPPSAPFLENSDLLVAADCTPLAYGNFHRDFLKGKIVLMGCPKFDDTESYVKKFSEILATATVRSVTVLVMEVPCCQGLPHIVQTAMERTGKTVPLEVVVISRQGERSTAMKLQGTGTNSKAP